jgi:hypothetical protein
MLQHETVGGIEVKRTSAGGEIPPHLDDEAIDIQTELMKRMLSKDRVEDISDEEGSIWIDKFSEKFRVCLNGYKGAYNLAKDTKDAQIMRLLYETDREKFYAEMQKALERQIH